MKFDDMEGTEDSPFSPSNLPQIIKELKIEPLLEKGDELHRENSSVEPSKLTDHERECMAWCQAVSCMSSMPPLANIEDEKLMFIRTKDQCLERLNVGQTS
jgi:hypothetical protein